MGILQDVFNALQAFEITKIDGQPTDDDINKLTTQLTAALVTISTTNGGGKLGHIGIVVPESHHLTVIQPFPRVLSSTGMLSSCKYSCWECVDAKMDRKSGVDFFSTTAFFSSSLLTR